MAVGKVNAVYGKAWAEKLQRSEKDYMVAPPQPWLDGINAGEDHIRQFVAMPLGSGYSAEEQITGEAEHGGLQIIAYPLKPELYVRRMTRGMIALSSFKAQLGDVAPAMALDMGLAPGGRMRQEIYDDRHELTDWDQDHSSR